MEGDSLKVTGEGHVRTCIELHGHQVQTALLNALQAPAVPGWDLLCHEAYRSPAWPPDPPGFAQAVLPDLTLGLLPAGTRAVLEVSPPWAQAGGGGVSGSTSSSSSSLPPRVFAQVRSFVHGPMRGLPPSPCVLGASLLPSSRLLHERLAQTWQSARLCADLPL